MDGDRIILCSDGVWSVIEDHEFGTKIKDIPIEETSEALINLALSRETDDNASVVAFQINALNKAGIAASIDKPNWLLKLRNITR
jgi:serine/threonine protein phosphatase PrpC